MNAELHDYLRRMVDANASDLFFSVGAPPALKIDGRISPLGPVVLSAEAVDALARQAMNERQQREFEETMEMNLAIDMPGAGRFRINLYRQRGNVAIAIRFITSRIPSLEQLNLPPVLHDLALLPRGLVLVVGAAGAGKSTTLDTRSYANALRNTMREAPDVLMIGEIRDQETMQAAIAYAETGHLCLATLHANNANQALDRIINFFPDTAHHQLLVDLSLNLKAVISQRLLRGVDGRRVPVVEILLSSPFVSELIEKGEIAAIRDAMKQGLELGMLTFDESIYQLYAAGRISYDEAMDHADSRTDLGLRIRLKGPHPTSGHRDDLRDAYIDGIAEDGRPETAEERSLRVEIFGKGPAAGGDGRP